MPTKYRFQRMISNSYLGETKVVVAHTKMELDQKIAQQISKWREQETKKRKQDDLLSLEARAERDTREAQARLDTLRNLLSNGLKPRKMFDWEKGKDFRQLSPFSFHEFPPTFAQAAVTLGLRTQGSIIGNIIPGGKKKRLEEEEAIRKHLQELTDRYEKRKAEALRAYEQKQQELEQEKAKYNAAIDEKRQQFENGDAEIVTWFLKHIIGTIPFPEGYGKNVEVQFEPIGGTAVISMYLPELVEIPRISGYKLVKSRAVIEPVVLKPKEIEALYDSVLCQMVLLTLHVCFLEANIPALQSIVFNGWVTGVNKSTGQEFASCIISVQASRAIFKNINLMKVDPKECIRSLKGLVAGSLSQMAPVKPIMEMDTQDKRFVESREVLANLTTNDNLATMDWEDFEHLVCELFSKIFAGYGSEVRVTQASRDGGVDAIAFDPDAIRGGKFVIQAKRYNKVVPVSAVRDLYGTMINEGAVKGILVTTSYFGHDSREFAKDKPISLIDGPNLVYMLRTHGYNVKIELQGS
ncbi:restriction endonuclease [Dictyobacter aurantiacus]|uniref:Restriction endonuclease n=1 Tax=Dictyobacter aurantiacus TaxID=1936993 RepID=A0A401ZGX4_9CHLR|nr:restriction endonuclease [Dictyobacter aurantiacus]GCE06117.1 restriction endonuclease [Dictyobacter aurantiacus]